MSDLFDQRHHNMNFHVFEYFIIFNNGSYLSFMRLGEGGRRGHIVRRHILKHGVESTFGVEPWSGVFFRSGFSEWRFGVTVADSELEK